MAKQKGQSFKISSARNTSQYAPAADLLNQIWTKKKGLKTLSFSNKGELKVAKSTYAQCANVLRHQGLLDAVLAKQSQTNEIEAKNEGLLYVLLYELLLGPNKAIRGGGSLRRMLVNAEANLIGILETLKTDDKFQSLFSQSANSGAAIPRYVRVNTLLTTPEEIVADLKEKHPSVQIYSDAHIPGVLVMDPTPNTREMLQHHVESNLVVLQDKSSCFSALCLMHGFDTPALLSNTESPVEFIDACAAPGNKTSHLAALVAQEWKRQQATSLASKKKTKGKRKSDPSNNCPTVHAFDRSESRFEMLQHRMSQLIPSASENGGQLVTVQCHFLDFLATSQDDFPNARGILLDPSCSGSGMASHRQDSAGSHALDPAYTNDRVKSLSGFQSKALQHAMKTFGSIDRIVYSTCSLYAAENEQVINRALTSAEGEDWELVSPRCLKEWNRRGLSGLSDLTKEQCDALIRVDPVQDETNGFFVACLQRKSPTIPAKSDTADMEWEIKAATGLSVYNKEFLVKRAAPVPKEKIVQKPAVSQNESKDKVSKSSKDNGGDSTKGNKRKLEDAATTTTSNEKINKKRAKKMEWKKRQMQQKHARLEKKNKQNEADE